MRENRREDMFEENARLCEEVDRLRRSVENWRKEVVEQQVEKGDLRKEVERLQELLRGTGANRYWENRWRDEAAENDKLRAALVALYEWYDSHVVTSPDEVFANYRAVLDEITKKPPSPEGPGGI